MRRIAALVIAGALGVVGTAALAGPAGAGDQNPFNADGQIKLKGVTGFVGDNLFDTEDAIGQRLSTFASPSDKAIFVIRAQNDRFQRNRIETWVSDVSCNGPNEIRFYYQGEDVTEEMFNDNVEQGLPAGGHFDVRMKIKVAPGTRCEVVVGSLKFGGAEDYVIGEVFSTQGGGSM
jgi:hypothetical protein